MSRRFIIIPARVIDDPALEAADIRILCAFGRETDRHGWCHVSQNKIATTARLSRGYVNTRIGLLSEAGYLEQHHTVREGRGRGASRYRLLFDFDAPPDTDSEASDRGSGPDVATDDIGPPMSTLDITPPVHSDLTAKDTSRSSLSERVVEVAREPSLVDRLSEALRGATGNAVDWESSGIAVLSVPLGWVSGSNPCDLELDVIPSVKALCAARRGAEPIRGWKYFARAIFEARDRRLSPNPEPKALNHEKRNRTSYDAKQANITSDRRNRLARIAAERQSSVSGCGSVSEPSP